MVLPKDSRESAYSHPTQRISDWEVAHAAGYHDLYPGGQADNPEGEPGDFAAGRLPLPILRAGWKGKKNPTNLVAGCGPCNTIKGTRVYKSVEDAKAHVLAGREELRKAWEAKQARPAAKAAKA